MEERNHHSLVLKKGSEPVAERLGFKVGSEEDLDRAARLLQGAAAARRVRRSAVPGPHAARHRQRRATRSSSISRWTRPSASCSSTAATRAASPQRIDHFNLFVRDVQATIEFYASLGFRLTEYAESEEAEPKIAAAWMHRKGGVHDLAFTNGTGPRLHHFAYWVPGVINVIHLCDVMATTGYLANMERGPGRHGLANAFFLYVRDPDGHRVEFYASDYLTVDPDFEPIRWSLRDPRRQTLWGTAAPRSLVRGGQRVSRHAGAAAGARLQADRGGLTSGLRAALLLRWIDARSLAARVHFPSSLCARPTGLARASVPLFGSS